MNLSLTGLELEGFKNFAARSALDLSALAPGVHFVRGANQANTRLGSNGAGKSTLFSDAVTWCLYGRTVGGLRTTDVRSWLTKKPPVVTLTFVTKDEEHLVQRGPKATELTIDGRAVGQEDVDALVGITFPTWAQAVVWGQGQPLFLDLPPGEKMGLLADALELERWERRAEAAAARAKRLEVSYTDLEGELRGLEAAHDHAQAALEEATAASEAWATEHTKRVDTLNATLKALTTKAREAEAACGGVDLAGEEAGVKAKLLRPDIAELRIALREQQVVVHKTSTNADRLSDEIADLETQLAAFANLGKCPTCGQAVTKKDAKVHATEIRDRISDLKIAKKTAKDASDYALESLSGLQIRLDKSEQELAEFEATERKATDELRALERRAAHAAAEANQAAEDLRRAEREENPHRAAGAAARARLREVETATREGTERAGKLAASTDRAKFWAKGFREIRLMVVDEVLDDLRATTAAVLDDLGLGEWGVDYATEKETKKGTTQRTLTVTVTAPGADEGVRWEVYSGGERQRLRLAGALALGEVLLAHAGVRIDFRVLDEPTRGLSREGIADLTAMLADYAEEAGIRLFYVDHSSAEGGAFASTIEVVGTAKGATAKLGA